MRIWYSLVLAAALAGARAVSAELPPPDFSSLLSAPSMQQPISNRETFERLRTIMDGPRHAGPGDLAERTYGPIVLGFAIPDAQKAHVLRLLQRRFSKVTEIRHTRFQEPRGTSDPKQFEASLDEAVRKATDPIDAEIAATVGPEIASFVAQLITVDFELSRRSLSSFRRQDVELGEPLSPAQRFILAVALHHLTEARNRWLSQNLPQSTNSHEPIDETQLTKSEQAALAEMTAGRLSPKQIEAMRRGFIFTERNIHGIPIEYDHDCDLPADAKKRIAKACGEDGPRFGRISVTMRGVAKAKLKTYYTKDDREFCAVVFDSTPWSKNGSPYLMKSMGVALFYNGELVQITSENAIEWTSGHPPAAKL